MRSAFVWAVTAVVSAVAGLQADDWPQWRGPLRDGISTETGLLKSWPEGGPKRLWQVDTEGESYASPVVVGKVLYVTGSAGGGDGRRGYLYALDAATGQAKGSTDYGPEWRASYGMARTTPTVVGNRIYLISGMGVVVCIGTDGKIVWQVDTAERFGGRNIQWGIAESPLVFDGKVICHPGGPKAAVAALDAQTGATRWTTANLDDRSAYCSPALLMLDGRRQVVTQTENEIVGISPEDGRVFWRHGHRNKYGVHPNTPIAFDGNKVLVSSGYGYGAEAVVVTGGQARQLWLKRELDNHFQGLILKDGLAYSSSGRGLNCFTPGDGDIKYTVGEVGKAQITMCEAGIVAYGGKGQVFLVRIKPDGYEIAGSLKVDFGNGEHWTTPVIANGILYVRHGRGLAAYDVRAP